MKKIFEEFKEFISRGNVVDMAVGVVIGSAFKAIVDSLVADILTPFIGIILRAVGANDDFASWKLFGLFGVGNFINTIISFFLIAIGIFIMVKTINKLHSLAHIRDKKEEEEEEEEKAETDLSVLQEIRDLLAEKAGKSEGTEVLEEVTE